MSTTPPLGQGAGYGIVLGLGFFFAFAMILVTWMLKRYNAEVQTSEMFSTAGHSVKSGLVASSVVSSWTWSATLLQSTAVVYKYGVSGAFWYASGATVQIILFATLAIELKRRAPNAHTFLEVMRARYGSATHIVFIVFGLMTNTLVTAMLLTGGSAVVESLTGMSTVAACFFYPLTVVLYTTAGGIKATILTDYMHTAMLIIIIFIFAFTAFATSSTLGSPGRVYDMLVEAGKAHPVEGNAQGSYLTMFSQEGGIFFVINIVGNFGTVFCDNGYYQKSIAASPVDALPGYILGGLAWFAVPFLTATTMGLSALALESNPVFPTFPNRMNPADVSAGLVLPDAAVALLGKGGAIATLLIVFFAVTSALSSELIAVSSIFTYDIYQTYINPHASGKRLIWASHSAVVGYAIIMASFSTGLYYAGISMGYLYLMMGVIIGSAVLPAALTLLWAQQSWLAATLSPPLGLICALIGWLVQAKKEYGNLSIDSTGSNYPMLVGNVVALLSPLIFVPVLTIIKPQHYDWQSMKLIRKGDDSEFKQGHEVNVELALNETSQSQLELAEEERKLEKAGKFARYLTISLALCLLILWPMPMFGSKYIFSKKFFTGWIVVGIIWLFCSAVGVVIFPIWEGRKTLARTTKAVIAELSGKGRPAALHIMQTEGMEEDSPTESIREKPVVKE